MESRFATCWTLSRSLELAKWSSSEARWTASAMTPQITQSMPKPTTKDIAEYFRLALEAGLCCEKEIESWADKMIPFDGILKFKPRFPVEDYLAHFRFLSLSGSSAQTCSHGIPLSGLWLTRSARRSNSSICSGDKPSSTSPNSSRILPVTSRRSFSGKRRICSKISVALMSTRLPQIYPAGKLAVTMRNPQFPP
jgi:hypothetical protein